MTPPPMSEKKFEQLVREHGFNIQPGKKHHRIEKADGELFMPFPISHSKNGKREVKDPYVKRFFKKVKGLEQ